METTVRIPNATKWTEELVKEYLDLMRRDAVNEDVDYLGIGLIRQGLYIQIWAYWKKKFAENDDIMEVMLLIESIFEARLVQATMRRKIGPNVASFVLRHNRERYERVSAEDATNTEAVKVLKIDEDRIMLCGAGMNPVIYHRREQCAA